ncbi:MAG: omega-6 fatty acid desaturase (delta-12 desaturase) [Bacteroidia bacterium]|jgi:omega-6 fatty acid desaturase (delta-12 desaturase)
MSNQTNSDFNKALEILKPFGKKNIAKANWQFFSTFILLWGSMTASFLLYEVHPYLSLIFIPISAALMCRSYVIEHDCGHQSFYRKKVWNMMAGNMMAFPIMIPYSMWKYIHNSHHNNVGNLDRRDMNPEMLTMTVAEFKNAPKYKQMVYRFLRSKFSRFFVAPIAIFGIIFRFPNKRFSLISNISVLMYDLLYALIIGAVLAHLPFVKIALVYLFPLVIFFTIASYVFYAQHQFEDTYWENEDNWSYQEATFNGSTYLTAPKWFNWMSGNVVYHNIHHLISTIPNYNLEIAQEKLNNTLHFKPISIFDVYYLLNLKLWDEEKKKLVPFKDH